MKFDHITAAPNDPVQAIPSGLLARRGVKLTIELLLGAFVFIATAIGWLSYQAYRDRHSPLPNGGTGAAEHCSLWFVGSSSMHKWVTVQADMRPWNTHNRGVDGAKVDYLASRFQSDPPLAPPSAIVLYAGENDIASGVSTASVFGSLKTVIAEKRARYGALPIFYVTIKPSPTRWRFRPQQAELNRLMTGYAQGSRDLRIVDIVPAMMVNGRPGPFYQADGIHLSHAGYRRWGRAVHKALESRLPEPLVRSCTNSGSVH